MGRPAPTLAGPSNVGRGAPQKPVGPMGMSEARRYMVDLINRDRSAAGLRPVLLDEGPPSVAAMPKTC
jgi:hypothetical protein